MSQVRRNTPAAQTHSGILERVVLVSVNPFNHMQQTALFFLTTFLGVKSHYPLLPPTFPKGKT
jgi:hypothetical protein